MSNKFQKLMTDPLGDPSATHAVNDARDKELLYEDTEGLFPSDLERASYEQEVRISERAKMSKENSERMAEEKRKAEEEKSKVHTKKMENFAARIRRNERGVRQIGPIDVKKMLRGI